MKLAVFDIGGTSVKHGCWSKGHLDQLGFFPTPLCFSDLLSQVKDVVIHYGKAVAGVAFSVPGAVNLLKRRIEGISAIPYLHERPVFDELSADLKLEISIENDANCAGLAEMKCGVGQHAKNAVFVILGTGVGGAVFINRELYRGAHLFSGEFGLLKSYGKTLFSRNGTGVKAAHFYANQTNNAVDGRTLFALGEAGDRNAKQWLDEMYDNIAHNLYNIQVTIDPEIIIIGGGISKKKGLCKEISVRLYQNLAAEKIADIMPIIRACRFGNEANLIGAALNFEKKWAPV